MKRKIAFFLFLIGMLSLAGCSKEYNGPLSDISHTETKETGGFADMAEDVHEEMPSVVKTYEVNTSENAFENDELVILVKHYEMSDGTWKTDDYTYKYRLVITGRNPNAVKDSTYVFLSNIEDISFQKAMMASGLSSNTEDYFDEEVAKFVGLK